ncbi:hypothetical protein COLO4_02189, partial [Corchorus olitorius]
RAEGFADVFDLNHWGPPSFEIPAKTGDGEADKEVDGAADHQDGQRFLQAGHENLRGTQKLDEAEPEHQRRILHDTEREPDPCGQRHAGGERQHDVAHVLRPGHAQRTAGAARIRRHGIDAAAHDLGAIGRRIKRQHHAGGGERRPAELGDRLEGVAEHELDEQRHGTENIQHESQRQRPIGAELETDDTEDDPHDGACRDGDGGDGKCHAGTLGQEGEITP